MLILKRIVLILIIFSLLGCSQNSETSEKQNLQTDSLLIYCGITMIRPMKEIADKIEELFNCTINITKGGSGNLLKAIVYNKYGDLYLPGSERYYSIIDKKYKGLILDQVLVGYNKAVIYVQKGNPLHLTNNLEILANPKYRVMIGNPDSGSIGKETKKILEKRGIYQQVVENSIRFTTVSKNLLNAIKNKEADITINWYAPSTWDDNYRFVETLEIDPAYAKPKKLILGLLKFTKHPDIARAFMELASSEKGKQIFKKYGLFF